MQFVDNVLIRLADPASRGALFTSSNLELLAKVAFDTDSMSLSGPFAAIFDEVTVGFESIPSSILTGQIGVPGSAETQTIQLTLEGFGSMSSARVDAIWRGSIVARTIPGLVPIESAEFSWTRDDIDRDIIAALGALPNEPLLEQERRMRFMANLKAGHHNPSTVTDESFNVWLEAMNVSSVGELLTQQGGTFKAGVAQVTFPPAPLVFPAPKPLPVAIALMIRDVNASVSQLLNETRVARQRLSRTGIEVSVEPWMKKRFPFVMSWVLPKDIFLDDDWPGANPTDRENRAATWLGEQGIGLVTITL